MNDDNSKELNMNELEGVAGGISPIGLDMKLNLGRIHEQTGHGIAGADSSTVTARCKDCGEILDYLGQERVDGGNTGKFKCKNKSCLGFGILRYNDEVIFQ